MAKPTKSEPKKASAAVQAYLVAYNASSLVAWAYVFAQIVVHPESYAKNYARFGNYLLIVQTFALLEIAHSVLRLVRSPVMTNLLQIGSRLTMVWAAVHMFPETAQSWEYTAMAFAWSLTEIVRYSFYTATLLGLDNGFVRALTFCRYNFFFVLYPLGAGSEWLILRAAFETAGGRVGLYPLKAFLIACLFVWPPGFYVMYTHMIRQRGKVVAQSAKAATAARKAE